MRQPYLRAAESPASSFESPPSCRRAHQLGIFILTVSVPPILSPVHSRRTPKLTHCCACRRGATVLNVEIVGMSLKTLSRLSWGDGHTSPMSPTKPPSRSMPLPLVRSARSYSAPIVVGRGCCGEHVAAEHQDALPASGAVDGPPGSGSVLMCRPLRSRERFICQEGTAQSIRA